MVKKVERKQQRRGARLFSSPFAARLGRGESSVQKGRRDDESVFRLLQREGGERAEFAENIC